MLNPSTVSICRLYINKELQQINQKLFELSMAKKSVSVLGKIPEGKRRLYLALENAENKTKARRLKLENAIRDLKTNIWNPA